MEWIERRPPEGAPPDVVVWVSVARLDASWKGDTGYYIGRGGTGAAVAGRYEKFGDWFRRGDPIEMSVVSYDEERGCISFTDGRHRFAWLRDNGLRYLPVQVAQDQCTLIEALFGSSSTSTPTTRAADI
jgi:hypothetical protein